MLYTSTVQLQLNIVSWSTKILKDVGEGTPNDRVQPWENMKNSLSYMP